MQMLPDSMQSFTPLVQGVAQSNALITVSQNGYTIYQKRGSPDHLLSQICNFRAAALISMSALRKQMVVFVPFWFPTLPCPICCNTVFQISILSPDAVRYMVSESGGLSRGKLYIWPQQSFDTLWRYDFIR